jgi:GSH-dependent disulfide-bond oxidoreductase
MQSHLSTAISKLQDRNATMIDLYYWTTPNGHKVTMFLEEAGLEYKIFPVQIGKGEQFKPEFLAIAPNNRIPALVDHAPKGGSKPISIFESGAMLLYLAEKTGKFIPSDVYGRYDVIQWTFWQMGGLGPMAGQNHHFRNYAVEKLQYAIDRYVNETNRLYGVLNKRLADREFIGGDYSIADMASYPWVVGYKNQGQDIEQFPHLKRWLEAIKARPAVVKAYEWTPKINPNQGGIRTPEERAILFGQTAQSVAAAVTK